MKNGSGGAKCHTFPKIANFCKFIFCATLLFALVRKISFKSFKSFNSYIGRAKIDCDNHYINTLIVYFGQKPSSRNWRSCQPISVMEGWRPCCWLAVIHSTASSRCPKEVLTAATTRPHTVTHPAQAVPKGSSRRHHPETAHGHAPRS